MRPRGAGAIVLVASTAGQRGEAGHSHYAASKGAMIAFGKSLAKEVGPEGIRVNIVAPGWVVTDMTRDALATEEGAGVVAAVPLGRAGQPEEIAGPDRLPRLRPRLLRAGQRALGQRRVGDGRLTPADGARPRHRRRRPSRRTPRRAPGRPRIRGHRRPTVARRLPRACPRSPSTSPPPGPWRRCWTPKPRGGGARRRPRPGRPLPRGARPRRGGQRPAPRPSRGPAAESGGFGSSACPPTWSWTGRAPSPARTPRPDR